jgi:hypothetical protein
LGDVLKSLKQAPEYEIYWDQVWPIAGQVTGMKFSYHLIRRSSYLAFRRKPDAFPFLTTARWGSGNGLIGGRRADRRCHVGPDRVGSDRLNWRYSESFNVIASSLFLIFTSIIRQVHIDLVRRIEVLFGRYNKTMDMG